jgi:alpha-tubulin suppressor-like RCC1 family protein
VDGGGQVRCQLEIADAVSVNVGDGFGCAARRSGEVWCWGDGRFGQLGDGMTSDWAEHPVRVQGISDAVHLSGSYEHTCVTRAAGPPMCWGRNDHHQVSAAETDAERVPVAVELVFDPFQ